MNEQQAIRTTETVERDINLITTEICIIKEQTQRMILESAIEIGRRLTEAKAMVPHGEWGDYLRDKVDFSQSTANNMMRIFEEYGDRQLSFFGDVANSQTLGNLTYTKALALLALPREERESFAEQQPDNLSTRDFEKAVRERAEALSEKEAAEKNLAEAVEEKELTERMLNEAEARAERSEELAKAAAADAAEKIAALTADLEKHKAGEKKAKERLKALKDNPEIPEEVMEKVRQEMAAQAEANAANEIEKQLADLKARQSEAEHQAETARQEADELTKKLATMEKQVKASNPAVTVFKSWFERVQEDWGRMWEALETVTDSDQDMGQRLRTAVAAVVDNWKKDIEP